MTDDTKPASDNPYRNLPSVDELLREVPELVEQFGHDAVTGASRSLLEQQRQHIAAGNTPDLTEITGRLGERLQGASEPTLKPVINLTGTVLHTNLGRASLPRQAIDAIVTVAGSPSNLEFDLETGGRGERESHVEQLICELTGAEAATVVNNNAAAVLLVLNSLALGKEVPVSRGELVEIGGSFRIPEVMERSGCRLAEVGATNRTHLKDYRQAIGERTALLMKVHTSNYQVQGFTKSVDETELAELAHDNNLPFVTDLGSGNLVDFESLGLPAEPTAEQALRNGADIITFSGDKLLGGPQAGIIAGRADLVASIRKNPLKRALRLDKMTLAALAEVLKLYRNQEELLKRLPTLHQLTRSPADITAQAKGLKEPLSQVLGSGYKVSVQDCHSQIGSGSLPVDTLASSALRIAGEGDHSARDLAARLRALPCPVIGRIHRSALWLDLRCLTSAQEQVFRDQLSLLTP